MKKSLGLKLSPIDGSEHIFSSGHASVELPETYSYKNYLPDILDQGSNPICVPCSISAYLNWRENLEDGSKKDNKIKYFDIYDSKTTNGDGMTFKDAFKYLRHEGVKSKDKVLKINEYAMINNFALLKNAIVANGPCVGALPVYNSSAEFWNKKPKNALQGYHAISIVGYDKEGFIIRNSWGSSWGNEGYTYITETDANKLMLECWTVVS